MWQSIGACVYLYLVNLIVQTQGITYLKGVPTPKWTTRKIPLEKWLEDNNWRLAPYGNHEFTKIFKQYKHVIRNKYYEEVNYTDSSLGKYVQSLFFTSTLPTSRRLLKKEKIKLGKLKLVKENIAELEAKLGLTTETQPTTPEPTTEPYTGPPTRKTTACSFDPDYIFDQNWPLKQFKRLRRDVSDTRCMKELGDEVSANNNNQQNEMKQNALAMSNYVNIFPAGDVKLKDHQSQNKRWIRSKRDEFGMSDWKAGTLKLKEQKLNRFKREFNDIITGDRTYSKNIAHLRIKRDLGSIVRRSTKRPHLSRKFKSQSMKRYKQDSALASMLTRLQSNITIYPGFRIFKQVMEDIKKNNLSTLFYVHNGVGYFGSVPPHLFVTPIVENSTMPKRVTFELGATQVLGANIFQDNTKVARPKVSPGDVEIPNINEDLTGEPKAQSKGNEDLAEVTEAVSKITKLKRGRKKKNEDINESPSDLTKKTRTKRKSTTPIGYDSLENTPSLHGELHTNSSQKERKGRKIRSVDKQTQDLVMEMLPNFLCFVHNDMHIRRKRNADNIEEEQKKIEDLGGKGKLGHFGKLKEHFKRSKDNLVSFVKEKKESLIDMPRRARYIAREMYLDGKFFFQELKEVPDRIKKDYAEKKEMFALVWEMLKIFMPVTEVGEKGGTTPEPKVVDDPKQYVKDYVTPDLSDFHVTTKRRIEDCEKSHTLEEILDELSTATLKTQPTKKISSSTTKAQPTTELRTSTLRTEPSTTKRKAPSFESKTYLNEESHTTPSSIYVSKDVTRKPIVVQDDPSTVKVYQTRVVGPDYVPTNTRLNDNGQTTVNPIQKVFAEKINDDETFDKISNNMKDKKFMENLINNVDTDRLQHVMKNLSPTEMLKKMNEKTVNKMGKLMSELDSDTIKNMQNLAMKTFNMKPPGEETPDQNKIETR